MKKLLPLICIFYGSSFIVMNAQNINTVAGNGTNGYFGDGGPAALAELSNPTQVVFDAGGNYFIADYTNNVIRRVDATSGYVTTVAGNGVQGYSGDGGPATSAELYWPSAEGVDNAGNIYISDALNYCIRKVDASSGIITTICGNGIAGASGDGGPASSAEINGAYGMAVDTGGNVFLADYGNNKIRMIMASSGIISTIAGTGTAGSGGDGGQATNAGLNTPIGVSVDASGNIYIADYSNQKIRMVTASTGIITTLAGNGMGGYSGDGGGATSAELSYPTASTVDGSGNLIIADAHNYVVREVNVFSGNISTIAGINFTGYSGDGGPATSAELGRPYGVAFDGNGVLYIADESNNRIRAANSTMTGTYKLTNNADMNIYPNPAKDEVKVELAVDSKQWSVEMYNIMGQKVLEQKYFSRQSAIINTQSLDEGIYMLKIQLNDGSVLSKKIEIVR